MMLQKREQVEKALTESHKEVIEITEDKCRTSQVICLR